MPPPRVLVLYNQPVLPADHPDAGSEHDILDTVDGTARTLAAAGFDAPRLAIGHDPQPLLDELKAHPPDAVFNLFEGLATQPATEVSVAALLEWLNVPFTGCPSAALALGRDKVRTKHLLAAAGIPTPAYQVIDPALGPAGRWAGGWPAIVKPACQDASVGIDQASVVTTQKELDARVRHVVRKYGPPVLVEEFVFGREFHANLVEDGAGNLTLLPLAEIGFTGDRPGLWPVYTFTAKWHVDSDEYQHAPLLSPVAIPDDAFGRLRGIGEQAFRLLGCRDYARLDVRMTEAGGFAVLEVNPNPYLDSLALVNGLAAIGRTHEGLVVDMALAAVARGGKTVPPGVITVPAPAAV
jgi:D-alanine-D-alanine ligase